MTSEHRSLAFTYDEAKCEVNSERATLEVYWYSLFVFSAKLIYLLYHESV